MRYFLVVIATSVSLLSCEYFQQSKHKDVPIARAYDSYLYLSDLENILPKNATEKDSATIVQNYIKNWIENKVLLTKAELNLSDYSNTIDRKIENYRTSLMIYEYEKELVNQMLDTQVTENQIEEYYLKNKQDFALKDYIVKVLYIKLDKKTPQLNKVRDLYKFSSSDKMKDLEEYCHKYAINFYLDTESWIYLEDLKREVPVTIYDAENFLKKNKYLDFEDDNYIYLLNIIDYNLDDDTSPLSLEKNNIKNIILNSRKLELITKMKKEVYQDAFEKQQVEIYGNE